ncbi:MAG: sensor histidine kinase [Chloroflexi bacterium]|nr:sensor histidine kinase [Chloroflexota bacterium]
MASPRKTRTGCFSPSSVWRKRQPPGRALGLGLLVCRRLVEAHGGRIRATSEPGRDSTFFLHPPIRQRGRGIVAADL